MYACMLTYFGARCTSRGLTLTIFYIYFYKGKGVILKLDIEHPQIIHKNFDIKNT